MKQNNILEVRDLKIEARPYGADPIPIVKGVSFDVQPGQVVGIFEDVLKRLRQEARSEEGDATTTQSQELPERMSSSSPARWSRVEPATGFWGRRAADSQQLASNGRLNTSRSASRLAPDA